MPGLDDDGPRAAGRLLRFAMNTPNAVRLADFYQCAFGAGVTGRRQCGERGGLECLTMTVGEATLEFVEQDPPGRPYPTDLAPYDAEFQHLALVTSDLRGAMERLNGVMGWSAISTHGPQRLPPDSGGVTAFKFRDPDGHPLEFLSFAPGKVPDHWRPREGVQTIAGPVQGVDHSALSCASVERSVEFYAGLGLTLSGRSLNQGVEQCRLDGVAQAVVDVVGLSPPLSPPHVELLHYQDAPRRVRDTLRSNDLAATRLIFETSGADSITLQDPDGHFVELRARQ